MESADLLERFEKEMDFLDFSEKGKRDILTTYSRSEIERILATYQFKNATDCLKLAAIFVGGGGGASTLGNWASNELYDSPVQVLGVAARISTAFIEISTILGTATCVLWTAKETYRGMRNWINSTR